MRSKLFCFKPLISTLILLWGVLLSGLCFGQSPTPTTTAGTDFWFGFTPTSDLRFADYVVYITSPTGTTGTLSIPLASPPLSDPFTVTPGVPTRIVITPNTDVIQSSGYGAPANQGIHVTAASDVSVFGAIETSERSDNTSILPVPLLANEYYVMNDTILNGTTGTSSYGASSFLVIAQDCVDSVQITPSRLTTTGNAPGVPFVEVLQPGQVFLVQGAGTNDLTGSHVLSLNHSETAVIAGAWWNEVECSGSANPFYEEMLPVNTWGKSYVFIPTPHAEDQCRVLSEQNGTIVTFLTGGGTSTKRLNTGEYFDTLIDYSTPVYISANNPISVGRFLNTEACNNYYGSNPGLKGDPSEVIVDADEQMLLTNTTFYVSSTPDMDSNYVTVVTLTSNVSNITLDGTSMSSYFQPLAVNPTYSYATKLLSAGTHVLNSTGQGFLAYYTGLGLEDAVACDAGVYLKNISATITASTPAGCSGGGSATVSASGIPPFTYLWSPGGQTTATATNLSAGTYTVTVSDGDCYSHKDTAIVTVGSAGGAVTGTVNPVNPSCTPNGSATVTATSGVAPFTYLWSTGATTTNITGLAAGSYYVIITDNHGCKDSIPFTLTNSSGIVVGINPASATICSGVDTTLTASGAQTYTWQPGGMVGSSVVVAPTVTTTYTVTGDSNGCVASATSTITIIPPPAISIIATPDTVCSGHPSKLLASGGSSYVWAPSSGLSCINCPNPICTPTANVTYTVIGSDAQGCTSAASITVYLAEPPTISAAASRSSICMGTSVSLLASSSNITSPLSWQPGGMTGNLVAVTPSVTTTYTVTGSNACSSVSATTTINVNTLPATDFTCDIPFGCVPLCVQFRDNSTISSGSIISWTWNFGDHDSTEVRNPIYCYQNAGVYTVDLTTVSDSGCSSTLKKVNYINAFSHPNASFKATPQPTTILQPTIQFTDKSTDAYGIDYWKWSFGDGSDSSSYLENTSHTYRDTGTYCSTLMVMNLHGCMDSVTDCVVISPIFTLYIPSAFTPNGNGVNDVFMAKGNDITSFEMYIFDRWGMELFHSTDINDGWNGTDNGGKNICQEDTYVYLITAYDNKHLKHTYTGAVYLLK